MRKLEGWKAVVSVPSQRKAWEVYPLEVYYPDDPTRLCRPKAGQSLVWINEKVIEGPWGTHNIISVMLLVFESVWKQQNRKNLLSTESV